MTTSKLWPEPPNLEFRKEIFAVHKELPKHSLRYFLSLKINTITPGLWAFLCPSLWRSSLASRLPASHQWYPPSVLLLTFSLLQKCLVFGRVYVHTQRGTEVSCSVTLRLLLLRQSLTELGVRLAVGLQVLAWPQHGV